MEKFPTYFEKHTISANMRFIGELFVATLAGGAISAYVDCNPFISITYMVAMHILNKYAKSKNLTKQHYGKITKDEETSPLKRHFIVISINFLLAGIFAGFSPTLITLVACSILIRMITYLFQNAPLYIQTKDLGWQIKRCSHLKTD